MTTKVDKNIGKQKFKAKRQYTVVVEFEGEAFTKDEFESLLPIELSLKDYDEYGENNSEIKLDYSKWYHDSSEHDTITGKYIQLDKTEKIGEYIPETYENTNEDGSTENLEDYEIGMWTNDDWEWKKNEDGTDKENDKKN